MSDKSLLALHESVQRQIHADRQNSGANYRFVGEHTKRYAQALHREMHRRELPFVPIDWP